MSFLSVLILYISALWFGLKSIEYIGIFSRKEYRFDRMRAYGEDFGWMNLMFEYRDMRPSRHQPRVWAIIMIQIMLVTAFFLVTGRSLSLLTAIFLLASFTAPIGIIIGVWCTAPLVATYRSYIVRRARQRLTLHKPFIIAITGSYGKSSTKEYLYTVLNAIYPSRVLKTPKNANTPIGIAQSILSQLHGPHYYYIIEMGAYREHEIAELCALYPPDAGIITGFGTQHLSLFGSRDAIIAAKSELARAIPPGGFICLSEESLDCVPSALRTHIKAQIVTYPSSPDTSPHDAAVNAVTTLCARIASTPQTHSLSTAVADLQKPTHCLAQTHPSRGFRFLDSSYSSNVDGFKYHLKEIASLRAPHTTIITSGIIELGTYKQTAYTEIVEFIDTSWSVYTTDSLFASMCRARGIDTIHYDTDAAALFELATSSLTPDSAVLIEGRFKTKLVHRLIGHS